MLKNVGGYFFLSLDFISTSVHTYYLTTLASYKLWAAYLISITLGGPGLTWSRLDIEVNGISCSALRITRCAFIATVIGRCHVRDD